MSALIEAQDFLSKGDFESARRTLDRHLRNKPADIDALYLLGICEQACGDVAAAREIFARVLKFNPSHFGTHYTLGLLLSTIGEYREAMPHHDSAISIQPDQHWAYVNRGNAKAKLKEYESAISDYQKALSINPKLAEAHSNLGNALKEVARYEESFDSFSRALQLRPDYPDALANMAALLVKLRRPEEALKYSESAIHFDPRCAEAWAIRGVALSHLNCMPEAMASYDRALELKPDYADAWLQRGNALLEIHRSEEALACFDSALNIRPDDAQAWSGRGSALVELKQHQAALESYDRALQIDPGLEFLFGSALRTRMLLGDWSTLTRDLPLLLEKIEAGQAVALPLRVLELSDDPAIQHQSAISYAERFHPAQTTLGITPKRPRRDKLRLGYYSADFRTHAVSLLACEMFETHDKSRFELFAFSFGPIDADPVHERVSRAFDHFIDVREKSDIDVARLSKDLGIDIAINLGGYTAHQRTDIFAMRAAPIQVNFLGYPGTMGAHYIDYLIADRTVCPQENLSHYTEKMAYLPDCFMPHDSQQAISSAKFARQDFSLPESAFVFCCFNKSYKLNPTVFDSWMRILGKTDNSCLWLFSESPEFEMNLRREAQKRAIDPGRLVFGGRLSPAEYLGRYQLADLFLDTLPFNAGTTAMDALWAGLPLVTCKGKSFSGRMAASLLGAIEMPELITESLEDYEALAVELASDTQKLRRIREKLANNRLTTPLFDTPRFTRHIEAAFDAMYERYQADLAPDHVQVGLSGVNSLTD
jgi:predicted O-linked N-acetylglucosamine transferase (SPINDLY family)